MKAFFPLILLLAIESFPAINQFNALHSQYGDQLQGVNPQLDKVIAEADIAGVANEDEESATSEEEPSDSYTY